MKCIKIKITKEVLCLSSKDVELYLLIGSGKEYSMRTEVVENHILGNKNKSHRNSYLFSIKINARLNVDKNLKNTIQPRSHSRCVISLNTHQKSCELSISKRNSLSLRNQYRVMSCPRESWPVRENSGPENTSSFLFPFSFPFLFLIPNPGPFLHSHIVMKCKAMPFDRFTPR